MLSPNYYTNYVYHIELCYILKELCIIENYPLRQKNSRLFNDISQSKYFNFQYMPLFPTLLLFVLGIIIYCYGKMFWATTVNVFFFKKATRKLEFLHHRRTSQVFLNGHFVQNTKFFVFSIDEELMQRRVINLLHFIKCTFWQIFINVPF